LEKCWASKYSPCGNKISREHLLTRGVFANNFTRVQGFPWCRDGEVEIGLNSLTAKILCNDHNNALSPLDDIGIEATKIFYNSSFLDKEQISPNSIIGTLDGHLFERWFLKTAINLSYKSNLHIGFGLPGSVKGEPANHLLSVVFGDIQFNNKMGLYLLNPKRSYLFQPGIIKFTPIYKDESIGGFWFHVHGYDFFLSLFPGHAPPTFGDLGLNKFPDYLMDATPIYRPQELDSKTEKQLKCKILFQW